MSIKINLGSWNSVFAVPSKVVDEGLKFSDGVKLKVLLYVLRNSGNELNENNISEATGVNVTDIPEALDYWISIGILQKSNGQVVPCSDNKDNDSGFEVKTTQINSSNVELKQPEPPTKKPEPIIEQLHSENTLSEEKPKAKPRTQVTFNRPQKPDYVYTAQRLAVDEELKVLVEEVQIALGKNLSNSDVSTLLMLKDNCGIPLDVILMLVQYCVSIDKGNMRAVEKIGVRWADDGINSIEAADNKIRQTKETSKNFSIISSAFGIKNVGSPTKKQLEYGDIWIGEWKFSPEMLREAYERCVDTKGTMNFRYIDGILKRWYSNNIRNKEDLKNFEKSSNKNTFKQKSSYDIDELEKIDTLDNF